MIRETIENGATNNNVDQEMTQSSNVLPTLDLSTTNNNNEDMQPPSYENATKDQSVRVQMNQAMVADLPSYETATNLPSYDTSQKHRANEIRQEMINLYFGTHSMEPPTDVAEIDCMFWTAFWLSLLFNWIGFFIGYCILGTMPSRCGALAGLGLSIANCLLYFRASGTCYEGHRLIVWWILLIISVVVFVKGVLAALKIRNNHRNARGLINNATHSEIY